MEVKGVIDINIVSIHRSRVDGIDGGVCVDWSFSSHDVDCDF